MDFQLKTLTVAQAAAEKSDVLIVLVGSAPLTSKDPLSVLAASARKAGDLPDKAGKQLGLYRPEDVVAFVVSDGARWITGASIPVDGGSKL